VRIRADFSAGTDDDEEAEEEVDDEFDEEHIFYRNFV
jgi:hypothetical protein